MGRHIGVDIAMLQMFLGSQSAGLDKMRTMYTDIAWTPGGPQHRGLFYAKSMNKLVEHVHIYQSDHSLRAVTYAEPEKAFEKPLLPFQRTYVCSDPPIFLLGSENTQGEFEVEAWASDMRAAGLPEEFIARIAAYVGAAIAKYERG